MSKTDKIEILDFFESLLKDHENRLDTLITCTEGVKDAKQSPNPNPQDIHPMKITLRDWEEFRDRALEANVVSYNIYDSHFTCKAITKATVYIYLEKTPEIELDEFDLNHEDRCLSGKLGIGPELFARGIKESNDTDNSAQKHELDALYTKNWLSRELCIHRDNIVQGSVG